MTPVVVAIPIAAAFVAVGAAVSLLVALAISTVVVPVIAHPVFVAAGVFPVVVLEFEAPTTFTVVSPGAGAVVITVLEAVFASLVMAIVVVVTIVAPGDAAHRERKY